MNILESLLAKSTPVVAPYVCDGLQARIAEQAGFEAVYMTGFGTAASRGLPDVGLLSVTEMINSVQVLADSVDVPVICDADTGYGNALNVQRTVRAYERAGASALHIEDQVWPKRCGFLTGKEVIPLSEMLSKVKAAVDASSDMLIIARTDALAPEGWDSVVERVNSFHEAGADLVFVDGIRTRQNLNDYIQKTSDIPKLYNGILDVPKDANIRLIIEPTTMLTIFVEMQRVFRAVKQGTATPIDGSEFIEMTNLLGVTEALAVADQYAVE
ncbi:MAG: isocitrate lyase/PEP mutase family protein [bacterium]|nr:isocitrate lyase/PEP mutase family protein [Gammaproteobacteria bacterium]HIL95004.1 isocitrate lyase/PEP mutase family protein [Pseudomonadales bacterium]